MALGFGIATPEHAALAAAAGADGVIVGTRLVRAAAEGEVDVSGRSSRASPARGDRVPARMGLVLTAVFGFVVWIVLWALGVEGVRRLHDHGRDHRAGRHGPHPDALPSGQPGVITRLMVRALHHVGSWV